MGISSSLSPQQSGDQSMAPERRPSRRWELGHSLWMLWLLTLGFGSFVGIVYAGIRARQPRWIGCGLAYAIAPIGFFASPQGSTVQTVFGFGCLVTGVVAAVHAFRFRRRYLGLISGNLSATHELTSGRPSSTRARATRIFQPPERAPTSPSIWSSLKPRPWSTSRACASRV